MGFWSKRAIDILQPEASSMAVCCTENVKIGGKGKLDGCCGDVRCTTYKTKGCVVT